MALDDREVAPEQLSDALLRLPWGAVLTPQGFDVPDDVPHVRLDGPSALCKSGDVVELNPLQRKLLPDVFTAPARGGGRLACTSSPRFDRPDRCRRAITGDQWRRTYIAGQRVGRHRTQVR
ncbi:hypothetical protein G6F22_019950 [Rhizopus arrhizus]|nr:hypothetical protein G6F22_019950 [Rhizopus arrhizus]